MATEADDVVPLAGASLQTVSGKHAGEYGCELSRCDAKGYVGVGLHAE